MISLYDEFINKCYNPSKHILLATGENSKDIISIYERYPNIIKGFGELKCYSEDINRKLPYGNLDWIKPVLEYNKDFGFPVYIHYSYHITSAWILLVQYNVSRMTKSIESFDKFLKNS
jgi:hypothetical protein